VGADLESCVARLPLR